MVAPLTIFLIFYFTSSLKLSSRTTKKAYEKAGGIAEEILYNIQTICSFGNFDYEETRFNLNMDAVFKCEKEKAYKYGFSQSIMGLSTYIAFTVAIFYGKSIIKGNAEEGKDDFKVGDMLTVILNMNTAVWSFTTIAPNIKIIIEALMIISNYIINNQEYMLVYFQLKKIEMILLVILNLEIYLFHMMKKKF